MTTDSHTRWQSEVRIFRSPAVRIDKMMAEQSYEQKQALRVRHRTPMNLTRTTKDMFPSDDTLTVLTTDPMAAYDHDPFMLEISVDR